MAKRRKIPPIPLEVIADNPEALDLSAIAWGALIKLAWHFWITECRPLPRNRLFLIAGVHPKTWVQYRSDIMRILGTVLPELARSRETMEQRRQRFVGWRAKGHATRRHNIAMAAASAEASETPASSRRGQARSSTPATPTGRGFTERRV